MKGIDILFNNAGICVIGGLTQHSDLQIQKMLEVNLLAPIRLTRHVVDIMTKQSGGSICFTASMAAWSYVPGFSVYCATKAGVKQFARALSRELDATPDTPPIFISSIFPFIVRTNLVATKEFNRAPDFVSYSPDQVAAAMLDGVCKRKREIFTGLVDQLGAYGDVFAPSVMDRIHHFYQPLREMYIGKETHGFAADQKKNPIEFFI